mmetsp:Transcript_18895/g.42646  ORF Transcript_18895/g.42646 Transcript_18895/m.42646 type:complete len:301 (-) Transcript_18895:38-940(-)
MTLRVVVRRTFIDAYIEEEEHERLRAASRRERSCDAHITSDPDRVFYPRRHLPRPPPLQIPQDAPPPPATRFSWNVNAPVFEFKGLTQTPDYGAGEPAEALPDLDGMEWMERLCQYSAANEAAWQTPEFERMVNAAAAKMGPLREDNPPLGSVEVEKDDTQGGYNITWIVEAGKLKGNEQQAVSCPFVVSDNNNQPLRMLMFITPEAALGTGHHYNFKKSSGRGGIHLKCDTEPREGRLPCEFGFEIGNQASNGNSFRGWNTTWFGQGNTVASLNPTQELWDFTSAETGGACYVTAKLKF